MRINCHTKKPDLNAFSLSTCQVVYCCGIFAFFYLNPGCVLAFCGCEKDAGDLKNFIICTEGLGWWSFMWLVCSLGQAQRWLCLSGAGDQHGPCPLCVFALGAVQNSWRRTYGFCREFQLVLQLWGIVNDCGGVQGEDKHMTMYSCYTLPKPCCCDFVQAMDLHATKSYFHKWSALGPLGLSPLTTVLLG